MQTPISFNAISGSVIKDGVIVGVSVITEGEAKGHGVRIDHATLLSVKVCADSHPDGVKVKSEHGTDFGSIVGVLRNFRISGQKLLADLHLLKTHQDFARIVEMAETMPGEVGLSISFSGIEEEIGGEMFARCLELYSVDLVDRPAANPDGLFRAVDSSQKGMDEKSTSFFAGLKKWLGETENAELSASQKQVTELSARVVAFESDLKARDEQIQKLSADIKAKDEAIAAKDKALSEFDAKVETAAAAKAQQIMSAVGQPPVIQKPAENPADQSPAKRDFKSEVKPLTGAERLALERK